jgi:sugar lactone lactonase YvrE
MALLKAKSVQSWRRSRVITTGQLGLARFLVGTVLLVSPIFLGAQDSLADRLAPAARAAIAKAPPLDLERVVVEVQVPPNWELGRISAAAIGGDGSVFFLHRGAKTDPVVVIDRNGRVLRSWGKGLFKIPHSIKVDADGNVWTTDAGDGLVTKFTPDGKKLLEIALQDAPVGKDCGFPSAAVNNFIDACGTTDILFLPAGRLFLTDGYGKMRVLEYTAAGERVRAWGGRGEGQGQFRVPHGLAYDGASVLFVADRDNGRLQRFDLTGRFLGEWTDLGRVGAVAYYKGALWATTSVRPSDTGATPSPWVIKVDPSSGKILGKIETTNADFIDIGANGDMVAGAVRTSLMLYRQTR